MRKKSAHYGKRLDPKVKKEMDLAWDAWVKSKQRKCKSINEIVDAYVAYAILVKKHIDPNWS